jgi:epoxyqueuosine reductase
LQELLQWDEATFLNMTEGSAIRRIGHARWIRNVALAAGNALRAPEKISTEDAAALVNALVPWLSHSDPVVQEQVSWSLANRT